MKVLLSTLVLALAAGGAYYFYFKDHPASWVQEPELVLGSASAGKKDFKEVCARLQAAMDRIPVNLHEARQPPAYAFDLRSKLAPHLGLHAEYMTVTQACDMVIEADLAFAEHQEKCGLTPAGGEAAPQDRTRTANKANPAMEQAQQTIWDHQRLQMHSKVRALLATLEGRQL